MKLDEGSVSYDGSIIGEDSDFLPNTGFILGSMKLLDNYNIYDNLKILESINGKADDKKINEVLNIVGLKSITKKLSKYSLGMHQRAVFAQAILDDPRYLILDEPTNGMDEFYTNKIKSCILGMKNDNRIIIITSHDKYFIEDIADEIITIRNGEVIKHEK